MSEEAQLVDLPEEEEKPKVKIFTPKVIILTLLACYFASQNLYYYITKPQTTQEPPKVQVNTEQEFWELFHRFKNYLIVSVVGFILFYYLRQSNDRHEEEQFVKLQEEAEKEEEEERKKQREREEKIIRKLEQQQKEAEERQMRMAASNAPSPSTVQAKQNQPSNQKQKSQ